MATNLVVNGVSYSYPQTGDQAGWGDQATFWATAVTNGMLQKAGGAFTLTGDANFGTNFGLISKYFTSVSASAAATGTFRLASTDTIAWRNNANTGDIALSKNASDQVLFNGIAYADLSSVQTFTNKIISGASNTLSNIAYSSLTLGGNIVNADISAGAAIAYSKLALTGAILNADLAGSIAYSKLSLTGTLVNTDISAGAAIAYSKLAALGANLVLVSNGSGAVSASAVSSTTLGFLDATSSVQTQLNTIIPKSTLTAKGDLLTATASATPTNLSAGTFGQVLSVDASTANGLKWTSPATGTKNYISFNNFENGATTGWSLGTVGTLSNGIPTGTPTFGSGSSNLALGVVSSGQLAGTYSLSLTASAATTVGNMLASQAYSIDLEDQAKVLTFKFYYSTPVGSSNVNYSGTSSNSFGIAIYDVTNSSWLSSTANFGMVQGSGVGLVTGTCQTNANTTSLRFVVYAANATAGAATLYFDDFFLGPQTQSFGPAMSDWVSSSLASVQASTFNYGTLAAATYRSRRLGDSLEVQGYFTNGTAVAAQAQIGVLYNGVAMTVDTAKAAVGGLVGTAGNNSSSTTFFGLGILAPTTNQSYVNVGFQGSTNNLLAPANASAITTTGGVTEFQFTVPIVGWSSNAVQSSDSLQRVVSWNGSQASQSVTANVTDIAFTTINDRTGSWNGTQFVVPVSGDYMAVGSAALSATATLQVFKGGSAYNNGYFGQSSGGGTVSAGAILVTGCKAGDVLSVRSNGTLTVTIGNLGIYQLAGPAVVQATESVNARYHGATATVTSTDSLATYTTKDFDSHNAYSAGTYTIPVYGKYEVLAATLINQTSVIGASYQISIYKNGALFSTGQIISSYAGNLNAQPIVTDLVPCFAGDAITFKVSITSGSAATVVVTNTQNYFTIARVGN